MLTDAMEESGMRPDEYAVYSLLFEKGPLTATEMAELLGVPLTTVLDYLKQMTRAGHPVGRGLAAQRHANAHWEVVRKQIEENLSVPLTADCKALQACEDSADGAARRLRPTRPGSLSTTRL